MAVQTVHDTESAAGTVDLGPAVALSCRECGERFPLGPIFACESCFGPLEVAYDLPADGPDALKKRIAEGPNNIWRYAPLLPVPADVAAHPSINPGFTKLVKADNLARELGITGELHVKDDSGNPTHSFKDRVVAIAVEAARAPWVPPPRGPASARACSSRTTWSRARSSWPPSTAANSSASRATTTT
jgi:threonine synthase